MKTSSFDLFGSVTTFIRNRFGVRGSRNKGQYPSGERHLAIIDPVDRNAPTLLRGGARRQRR